MTDTQREAFITGLKLIGEREGLSFADDWSEERNEFADMYTQWMWLTWQAALTKPQAQQPTPEQFANAQTAAKWLRGFVEISDQAPNRDVVKRVCDALLSHPGEQAAAVPAGWREFVENIATAGSEPLNSLAGGSDKASRRHWLGVIRDKARAMLSSAPAYPTVAAVPENKIDRYVALISSAPAAPQAQGWLPIESAPDDMTECVVVRWKDSDGEECHRFDFKEEGCWMDWHNNAEHVEMIGGHGVSYTPPYESWMPLPAPPAGITGGEEPTP
jgi:hypothetical protein